MYRLTMILNPVFMFLFWLACLIAITPAHNLFVVYGPGSEAMSLPTPSH